MIPMQDIRIMLQGRLAKFLPLIVLLLLLLLCEILDDESLRNNFIISDRNGLSAK